MVTAICRGKPMKYMGEGEGGGMKILHDHAPFRKNGVGISKRRDRRK